MLVRHLYDRRVAEDSRGWNCWTFPSSSFAMSTSSQLDSGSSRHQIIHGMERSFGSDTMSRHTKSGASLRLASPPGA
jgi:hypothetical protein